jgi:DNA-binding NarL/FixJ family response regulator
LRPVAVVAVSDVASRPQVFRLRDYGVDAYLEKPINAELLRRSLLALVEGRELTEARNSFVGVRALATGRLLDETLASCRTQFSLTSAEMDVLRCAVAGLNRSDIARERSISPNTVKTQVRALLNKSGQRTLRALVLHVCARVQDADLRAPTQSAQVRSPHALER